MLSKQLMEYKYTAMKTFKQFNEDGVMGGGAPTNAVGGGAIAGIGVGPQGEPGVKKKKPNPIMGYMQKRKPKLA